VLTVHFLAISRPGFPATIALERTACVPFREERRMQFTEATKFHRKSGGEPPALRKASAASAGQRNVEKSPCKEDLPR
jgi:hypothetical protein